MSFTLPNLPYAMDALAPHMTAETLEYHYGKHHNAYAKKATEMAQGTPFEGQTAAQIIPAIYGKADQQGFFNNVSQFYNHVLFWQMMQPNGGGNSLPSALQTAIDQSFGGYQQFRDAFIAKGMGQFGSGWVWLAADNEGELSVMGTPNGENPLCFGKKPILGCDVWEHSYYIDYRNDRSKYLNGFLDNLVNWEFVESLLSASHSQKAAA